MQVFLYLSEIAKKMLKFIKKYKYLFIIVFIGFSYLVTVENFPKSLSHFPFYIIIFLFDLYLWKAFSKEVYRKRNFTRNTIIIFYWTPLFVMVIMSIINLFYPLQIKNNIGYTYIVGLVFMIYGAKTIAAIIILLSDVIRFVNYIWRFLKSKGKRQIPKTNQQDQSKISRSKFLTKLCLLTGGVVLSTMLIGRFKWVSEFRIRKENIKLPNLPNEFDGLRIVQLSDLHLGSWTSLEPLRELVKMVNSIKPDVIFFTGDLVNFSTGEAFNFEDILKQLKAKYGVFSILGNHDYGDYVNWNGSEDKVENMNQLYSFYKRIGWKLLRNDHVYIRRKEEKIVLIGVENWGANKRFPQLGSVDMAQKGVDPSLVKILLSHDPSHFDKVILKKHKDIDLTLSGHTHGFQFGIETPNFKWSPAQYIYKYWAGLYKVNNQYIYVNRGAGFLGYPGRIGIFPEIAELTLLKT
jgi:predicted MPP superfamily phosphohydrolase